MKKLKEPDTMIAITICIILILLGCLMWLLNKTIEVSAAVITGEKQLGGISLLRQQVIDAEGELVNHEDLNLLAEVMYHENYSNGYEVMLWTGSVVLNRVASPRWPDTISKVLYQENPRQYSTTHKFYTKKIPQEVYDIALHLLLCGSAIPPNVMYQSTHPEFGSGVWRSKREEYFCYE